MTGSWLWRRNTKEGWADVAEADRDQLMTIFDRLFTAYGPRHWWPARTPYEMMVGAILTQNTAWTNVEKAIRNFEDQLSPEFVAAVSLEELAGIIKPCGYFNQKARHLKHLTSWFEVMIMTLAWSQGWMNSACGRNCWRSRGWDRKPLIPYCCMPWSSPFL